MPWVVGSLSHMYVEKIDFIKLEILPFCSDLFLVNIYAFMILNHNTRSKFKIDTNVFTDVQSGGWRQK